LTTERNSAFEVSLPTGQHVTVAATNNTISRHLLRDGWRGHEAETLPVFIALARAARSFLDIGANIGWYTLVAKAVNPACHVVAFEPSPEVAEVLERNLRLNGLGDVRVERAAASSETGMVQFYVSPSDSSSSTLKDFRAAVQTLTIPAVSLDDYVAREGWGRVDLVKVDVEGNDHLVLRGMTRLLAHGRPDVLCEVLKRADQAIADVMRQFPHYRAYWVTPEGLVPRRFVEGDAAFESLNYLFTTKTPAQLRALGIAVSQPAENSARRIEPAWAARPCMSLKCLLYCDADLNFVDGSAIWTVSVAQVLALDPGTQVTLLLKKPLARSLLTAPLEGRPNVELLDPFSRASEFRAVAPGWERAPRLQPEQAARLIVDLDQRRDFDLILVRGLRLSQAVVSQSSLAGRVWAYITDFTDDNSQEIASIHRGASRLLCQTPQLRDHIKNLLGVDDGKFLLLPPMIPDLPPTPPDFVRRGERLVYVGKIAPLWRVEEMLLAVPAIRSRHSAAEFHVAGDKFHNFPPTEDFEARLTRLLENTPGVIWHKAMTREQTQQLVASCDVGTSWRHPDLDQSLELSTKVLEYGAQGKPVLLNRVPMHEELLGRDYPLFCNSEDEYLEAVSRAFRDEAAYRLAAERAYEASRRFTFSAALERLRPHLPRPGRDATRLILPGPSRALRVVFAGHDLKFAQGIMDRLRALPGVELQTDEWAGHQAHDPQESRALAEWADVVVAEWCLGNAVWYSHHLPPRTGLIIRCHRVELETTYPEQLDKSHVHRFVTVSPHYRALFRDRLSAPDDRVVSIPNAVDCEALSLPKLGGDEFRLGLLGLCPKLKRLDLASDIFDLLRRRDRRYLLFVKGKWPTEYRWLWKKPEEREYYQQQMARINAAVWRDSVVFEPFGNDVPAWFRKIGFILSPSDIESFHLSVAEGMASGAIPIIRNREEVPGLYPPEYVFSDTREAARLIEEFRRDPDLLAAHQERVKQYVKERYDCQVVVRQWRDLIAQVREEAQAA